MSVTIEFCSSLTTESHYHRMYECLYGDKVFYKEVTTKRNEGGFADGEASVLYHFGGEEDKSEFLNIKDIVEYIDKKGSANANS